MEEAKLAVPRRGCAALCWIDAFDASLFVRFLRREHDESSPPRTTHGILKSPDGEALLRR